MTKTYNPDEGFAVELLGIDDQPLFNDDGSAMTITIIGEDSDIAVASRHAMTNRRLKQGASAKFTAESFDSDGVAHLVKITAGWNITPAKLVPGIDPGLGEGLVPFTPGAATKLYGNPKLKIIRDQPDKASTERANFLRA